MSNEEKILAMLNKMQSDIDALRTEVKTLKLNGNAQPAKKELNPKEQWKIFKAMSELLDDDEKDALGKYMEAEEARKVALYG